MERENPGQALSRHVVICNVNAKIPIVVQELRAARGVPLDVVLIIQDRALWEAHPKWHPPRHGRGTLTLLYGCPSNRALLRRANVSQARAAIILSDPLQGKEADARSTLVAVAIERENPQVHTVIELILSAHRDHLRATKIDEVICLGDLAEKLLAQSCITPGSNEVFAHLLTTASHTNQIFLPRVPLPLVGRSWRTIARRVIECGLPFTVCGFVQRRHDERPRFALNPRGLEAHPNKDTILKSKDQLIIIARDARLLDDLVKCAGEQREGRGIL
ncbi:NAD-binding protein [Myxococcota bacterium]|nr:NAD-binding protein [Myxococcota bacterium]MBU1431981.1 NAD-binding protein [Myxococcota bacterium]MBU1899828.1 NAD-binding protein [Myxococcota bacterium]